jgi:hypothetical protein
LTEKSSHLQLDSAIGQLHALANIIKNFDALPADKLKDSTALIYEVLRREAIILANVFSANKTILTEPEHFSLSELTSIILSVPRQKLCYREKLTPHGEKIANYMCEHNLMVDFIKLWRQHFMDTMKPSKMPFMWDNYPAIYEKFQLQHPSVLYA